METTLGNHARKHGGFHERGVGVWKLMPREKKGHEAKRGTAKTSSSPWLSRQGPERNEYRGTEDIPGKISERGKGEEKRNKKRQPFWGSHRLVGTLKYHQIFHLQKGGANRADKTFSRKKVGQKKSSPIERKVEENQGGDKGRKNDSNSKPGKRYYGDRGEGRFFKQDALTPGKKAGRKEWEKGPSIARGLS